MGAGGKKRSRKTQMSAQDTLTMMMNELSETAADQIQSKIHFRFATLNSNQFFCN
jgi:hypothetical protein